MHDDAGANPADPPSKDVAEKRGLTIVFRQSNSEAEIIDWIHGGINGADGIIINPAAFTHTSVAILDALSMVKQPIIELHISNPHKREAFRHHSYVTLAATALICGLGVNGYPLAVALMAGIDAVLFWRFRRAGWL